MDFAEKIKTLRKQKGLTLRDVGEYCGVGFSTVRKWEQGYIENVKRDKIVKLSELFSVQPTYLLGMDDTSDDKEIDALLDGLRNRPEGKMLFKTLKGATKDDILTAVSIIDALKKKNG